jgi:hypothetical protein
MKYMSPKRSGGLTKIKRGSFKKKLVILSSLSARLHVEIEEINRGV